MNSTTNQIKTTAKTHKKPIISLKNISKTYHSSNIEIKALSDIDLDIMPGDYLSISGPSGCGKSTLLSLLGLLDSPSKGEYLIENVDTSQLDMDQQAELRNIHIGFVFQSFNLIDELSVYENVELPLIFNKVKSSERKKRVTEILERIGIAHRAKHFPLQLSGGQQQRVAVARALVTNPKLILADEPTGNLDSKSGNDVMELLTELHASGATIIMVTHSSYDAQFSSRVITLKDGEVISQNDNTHKVDVLIQ